MYCTSVEPHPIDTLAVSWFVGTVFVLQGLVMVFAGCEALVKVSFYFVDLGGGLVRANGMGSIRNRGLRGCWMRDLGCEDAGRCVFRGAGFREDVVAVL